MTEQENNMRRRTTCFWFVMPVLAMHPW